MSPRKRLVIALLVCAAVSAVFIRFTVGRRPLAPPVVVGPYLFRVVAVSNERMRRMDRRLPAEQVWITVQLEPSDPKKQTRSLHAYLPHLFENTELVGPDGSRQKPFWRQEYTSFSPYDKMQHITQFSRLQTCFGFDNTFHWKTATLMTHFDSSKWGTFDADEMTVSGQTLRISPIKLP